MVFFDNFQASITINIRFTCPLSLTCLMIKMETSMMETEV